MELYLCYYSGSFLIGVVYRVSTWSCTSTDGLFPVSLLSVVGYIEAHVVTFQKFCTLNKVRKICSNKLNIFDKVAISGKNQGLISLSPYKT